jgi:hypothetical protein
LPRQLGTQASPPISVTTGTGADFHGPDDGVATVDEHDPVASNLGTQTDLRRRRDRRAAESRSMP